MSPPKKCFPCEVNIRFKQVYPQMRFLCEVGRAEILDKTFLLNKMILNDQLIAAKPVLLRKASTKEGFGFRKGTGFADETIKGRTLLRKGKNIAVLRVDLPVYG